MPHRFAVLFPGQGAYYEGALSEIRKFYSEVDEVFSEIDEVTRLMLGSSVSDVIFESRKRDIQEMLTNHGDLLQAALYGIAVASYRIMEARGFQPAVLVGHSFGEIAALVCSGAFTVRQGAEIVCHRIHALKQLGNVNGRMAALNTDAEHAGHLVALLRNEYTVISVENHRKQVVISGLEEQISIIQKLSEAIKLRTTILDSPYPFHNPLLQPAVHYFSERMGSIQRHQASLRTPVYSPILGRYYTDDDKLTSCLAEHLIEPVQFPAAIQSLYAEGIRAFVECGAKDTLSNLVANILYNEGEVHVVPCLLPNPSEYESFQQALDNIEKLGGLQAMNQLPNEERLVELFWTTRGPEIQRYIREELKRFLHKQSASEKGQGAPQAAEHSSPSSDRSISSSNQSNPSNDHLIATATAMETATATATTTTTATNQSRAVPVSREQLLQDVIAIYASELEYPEEVFEEHVALEAELGVDSVKQTELMARVSQKFELPPLPANFRMSEVQTLGAIVDFIHAVLTEGAADNRGPSKEAPVFVTAASAPVVADTPVTVVTDAPATVATRDTLLRELVAIYAEALEYPEEVFTEDAALEAELGVDSVKQTELMARISEQYGLPERPLNFRLSDYPTLGKIADFVFQEQGKEAVLV
ncbi:Acyl carrier protein [Paenibacillus plantiphilus]|uniref:[acyl-carrier-protein] S-malonyltransferase n=1 Tax=Paenibacillus plantiphilus TaxID=2905650 RepID=A0ABN8GAB0_9BACL|nr:acyltransferase domain-containing protein [Paenibacillus plantiphilus]CAH1201497.1 Acyl carrier protein [Paenibacillus plantiphilus]